MCIRDRCKCGCVRACCRHGLTQVFARICRRLLFLHRAVLSSVPSSSCLRARSAASRTDAAHGSRGLYFPSYEIMMDDLRDYRFYDAGSTTTARVAAYALAMQCPRPTLGLVLPDLLHPSDTAVEYIWDRFEEAPFDASSAGHQSFLRQQLRSIQDLEREFPHVRRTNDRK
eukprot:1441222-Rhodomonas_salina.1